MYSQIQENYPRIYCIGYNKFIPKFQVDKYIYLKYYEKRVHKI